MAVGDKIAEITFDSIPEVEDGIIVSFKVIGGGITAKTETFWLARVNPGDVAVVVTSGAEDVAAMSEQALRYANAFNADYNTSGQLLVTVVGTRVAITIPQGSTFDYIDSVFINDAYASVVLFQTVSNNVIHKIWWTPTHSTPSVFSNNRYIVANNGFKLISQSGKKIIKNG